MKSVAKWCLLMMGVGVLWAGTMQGSPSPQVRTSKIEIAEFEAPTSAAKSAGLSSITPVLQHVSEPGAAPTGEQLFQRIDLRDHAQAGGTAQNEPYAPEQLTPLEARILRLEFELGGGLGPAFPDPATFANLKAELNELYAQRPANREHSPLDQGSDTCPGLEFTTLPYTDSGTTVGMTDNYSPSAPCGTTNAADVVYWFRAPSTQTYSISLLGSEYDTYLYVIDGFCAGTVFGCNDDFGGLQSYLEVTLNGGQFYVIVVDGYMAASGNYTLTVSTTCDVTCAPDDVIECAENPDSSSVGLDCNGGCANVYWGGALAWQDMFPYQTICGRTAHYTNGASQYYDTDQYLITVTEPCSLRVFRESEVGLQLFLYAPDSTCGVPNQLWFAQTYWLGCTTGSVVSPCLAPGKYILGVKANITQGWLQPMDYRVRYELVPCSGCDVDGAFAPPSSVAGSTCGAGNDNSLRPSEELTYLLYIPYAADWRFTTCGSSPEWDSYMYLTTACNSGLVAENDDGCGTPLSGIECMYLTAGYYYVTIEGATDTDCGDFVLSVGYCIGKCCYGSPASPQCDMLSPTDCAALGGAYDALGICGVDSCPAVVERPVCLDGSVFSQLPEMPGEGGSYHLSDSALLQRGFDNFTVAENIRLVTFWGLWQNSCVPPLAEFDLLFVDSVSSSVQTYTTPIAGDATGITIDGYQLYQYTTELIPRGTIHSGWFSVQSVSEDGCGFAWAGSPFGDNVRVVEQSGIPQAQSGDFAFCLNENTCKVDSVTLKRFGEYDYELRWWQSEVGLFNLYVAHDPNAVYPVGYTYAGSVAGNVGQNQILLFFPQNYATIVGDVTCGGVPTAGVRMLPTGGLRIE